MRQELTCVEICAGAGGQGLGLEQAGFAHVAAVEIDPHACETLRLNRPEWDVIELDVHHFKGVDYRGVDLLAGGVPAALGHSKCSRTAAVMATRMKRGRSCGTPNSLAFSTCHSVS